MKVLVVIITKDTVKSSCMESVLKQDYPNFDILIHVKKPTLTELPTDPRATPETHQAILTYLNCSQNREVARKIALASDADKFFFVDSDIILPEGAVTELVSQPFDVIGGWYKVRNENRYTCGRWMADNVFLNLWEVEPSVVKVDQVGMGCAMFSRKALSDIYFESGVDKWARTFIEGQEMNLLLGECGSVGNLLNEKGYQLYMDGSVVCEHDYENRTN